MELSGEETQRFPAWSTLPRNTIAFTTVGSAVLILDLLMRSQLRTPLVSVFIAAIVLSFRYGGDAQGLLALGLSSLSLPVLIRLGTPELGPHDLPSFISLVSVGLLVYSFGLGRRQKQPGTEDWHHLRVELTAKTTEVERFKAEYDAIFNAAPQGIARFAPGRVLERSNPAFRKIAGWAEEEIKGRHLPLPQSEVEEWEQVEERLRRGRSVTNHRTTRIRKDGSEFPAAVTLAPVITEGESFTGYVEILVDESEHDAEELERTTLAALVQHSPGFVGIADLQGRLQFVNPKGQAMFGLESDDRARQTNILDYLSEGARESLGPGFLARLRQQEQIDFETWGKNFATGELFPVHSNCFVVPDSKTGQPSFLACIAQDVTERRRAQESLLIFRSIVRNSPVFIGVCDLNLRMICANPAFLSGFGLESDEQVKETNAIDYFGEEVRNTVLNELLPVLLEQGHLTADLPARNLKTGEIFPVLWTTFVIYDQKTGEPAMLAIVARDMSNRKRNEDAIRRRDVYLTEGERVSHTGTWAWNATARTGYWSEEFFRIVGADPETVQPSLENFVSFVHPDDQAEFKNAWDKTFGEGIELQLEHRIVQADGSTRYVRCVGRRFSNGNNGFEFIGAIRDVTSQHEETQIREKAYAEITRLLEQKKVLEDQLHKENISLKEKNRLLTEVDRTEKFAEIIGSSPAIRRTLDIVEQAAPTDLTVLITGETGTGKEMIARAIHMASRRSEGPFISFNCAALTPSLAQSELFGHDKGSFTGAYQKRQGYFDLAEGGTIFLDEVGDIPAATQILLLRVLQEHEFERVGGGRPIRTDVRVIAATNRNLVAAIEEGAFRSDLYYRLNGLPIEMPALRHRREDIPVLVEHFVQQYAHKIGKNIMNIDWQSMKLLESYDWPGNIRQLQNVIEGSVVLCKTETLVIDEQWLQPIGRPPHGSATSLPDVALSESRLEHDRQLIEEALTRSRGHVKGPNGAAKLLRTSPSTLYSRMKALGINWHLFRIDFEPGGEDL